MRLVGRLRGPPPFQPAVELSPLFFLFFIIIITVEFTEIWKILRFFTPVFDNLGSWVSSILIRISL